MSPYLSVIIPAFNEVDRINNTLKLVDNYLQQSKYSYEIIVVDDGSSDGTRNLVEDLCRTIKSLKVFSLPNNQGKGVAVKAGMLQAEGKVRLFMDADGSTDIREIEKFLPLLSKGYDAVFGSRLLPGSVKKIRQSFFRELLGWIYRKILHILIKTYIKDTQNGFKLFSGTVAEEIFSNLRTKGWSFDIEVILLMGKVGYKIKEMPIVWSNDKQSKMTLTQMCRMLLDILLIRNKYFW